MTPSRPRAARMRGIFVGVVALSALLNLGCAKPAAEAAVRKAKTALAGGSSDFETLFRRALELVR